MLVVESFHSYDAKHRTRWYCKCDCGRFKIVRNDCLIGGHTQSCGCAWRKARSARTNYAVGEIRRLWWNNQTKGALDRQLKFTISPDYAWELFLKQDRKCALSGIPLRFKAFQSDYEANASIDRIDSSEGYIPGNVQWVDKRINRMKQNFSQCEFLDLCRNVYNFNAPVSQQLRSLSSKQDKPGQHRPGVPISQ